jgi:hypothetical protein
LLIMFRTPTFCHEPIRTHVVALAEPDGWFEIVFERTFPAAIIDKVVHTIPSTFLVSLGSSIEVAHGLHERQSFHVGDDAD